jgi:CBS domain-containing protein
MQKLRDIMTRNVEIITPNATVQEAAKKMQNLNVGALPVCDGDKLSGMITDRDLVMRVLAEGRNPKTVTVSDVTSSRHEGRQNERTYDARGGEQEGRQNQKSHVTAGQDDSFTEKNDGDST